MRIQANKLEIGDDYYQLGKTIQINFVKNSKLNLGDKLITNFHICSDDDLKVKLLEEHFCIKIIQIDKIKEFGYTNSILEKWLSFIGTNSSNKRKDIAEGDELLMELNDWVKKYVNDEETQEKLNKWDLQIAKNNGYEEGKEEGMAEEKIKIIKNMLNENLDIKDISKYMGLSIEEIEKLKETIKEN